MYNGYSSKNICLSNHVGGFHASFAAQCKTKNLKMKSNENGFSRFYYQFVKNWNRNWDPIMISRFLSFLKAHKIHKKLRAKVIATCVLVKLRKLIKKFSLSSIIFVVIILWFFIKLNFYETRWFKFRIYKGYSIKEKGDHEKSSRKTQKLFLAQNYESFRDD